MPDGFTDGPFMLAPVKNPELDLVKGMSAPLPADGPPPSIMLASMADTSLSLGVALEVPGQWTYDFDLLGNARASFPNAPPGNGLTVTAGAGINDNITVGRTGNGGGIQFLVPSFSIGVPPLQNAIILSPGGSSFAAATMGTSGTGPLQMLTTNFLIGAGGTNQVSIQPGATVGTATTINAGAGAGALVLGTTAVTIGGAGGNALTFTPGAGSANLALIGHTGTGAIAIQSQTLFGAPSNNQFNVVPGNVAGNAVVLGSSTAGGITFNSNVGFNTTAPVARQTVTGSRAANAALASLLTALAATGLLTDGTTA